VVEAFAIDEKKGAALLGRQVAEEARGQSIELRSFRVAAETLEARVARLHLTHGIGVVAELMQPETIDLAEGPSIERRAPLIAMLLVKHALQRSAKKGRAFPPLAD
jgi:hypothetical protein